MKDFSNSNGIEMVGAVATAAATFEGMRLGIPPEKMRIRENDIIGGRVQTLEYAGRTFDRCAHWFHGGPDNVVYQYAKQNLLPEIQAEFGVKNINDILILENFRDIWVIGDNGRTEKNSNFRVEGHKLTRAIARDYQSTNPGKDASLAICVDMASPEKREVVSQWVRLVGSLWIGLDPSLISMHEVFGKDGSFDDNNGMGRTTDYLIKGGLGRLSKVMYNKLQSLGVQIDTGYNLLSVKKHGDGYALSYDRGGQIETCFSKAANITIPVAQLKKGLVEFDSDVQQDLHPELDRFENGNFSKIIVPLEVGALRDRNIADQQRVYSFGNKDAGTFFCVFCPHSDSITLFGSDLSQLEGSDPKLIRRVVASVTDAFPELRGLDSSIVADPLVINPMSIPSLGGAYSGQAIGCGRPGRNYERNGLALAGEWRASNEEGAKTIEGAWASGLRLGAYNAKVLGLT